MASKYDRIKQLVARLQLPDYRYRQILNAIFKQRIGEYARMQMLPASLRAALAAELGPAVSCAAPAAENVSRQVTKTLLALPDGAQIEAVALRYKRGWESFCLSTQCGCGFACRFCATGTLGLRRNMTAEEITDQVLYLYFKGHELDSISFMGMGEPLANPALFDALALLTDKSLLGLSPRRITVSTIGILPGIQRLTRDYPQINLAFSLHSPFEEQRTELMPINARFPLHAVLAALDEHIQNTGRKVFLAYVLLEGINDSPQHAAAVAGLLRGRGPWARLYHVDLIPYNATDKTPRQFKPSDKQRVRKFREKLESENISVTVRTQFGSDIAAACGQLHGADAKL
ncbi:MAG: 23S rRNA (adenine(2503)-C(8))-methyltransferase Cfr [Candidatus Margulisbacteria bacterium]|jgi:23S rRNA (adenine-C8)-methyltransferase|nr:23S rRNA (adenine(2503)-C(8))-methyltransferase Cfr [Candidatus Margulisiibacteriota bacterium]